MLSMTQRRRTISESRRVVKRLRERQVTLASSRSARQVDRRSNPWLRTTAFALLVCVVGCGRSEPGSPDYSPGAANPSVVALHVPPPLHPVVNFGGVSLTGSPSEAVVRPVGGVVGSLHTIHVTGTGVTGLGVVERDGVRYLLVAELEAGNHFRMERFHDDDGDGWPDESSKVLLLASGDEPMFVVSIAARSASLMYMADARCGDILVATDRNADGWVDTLVPRRFARRDDRPDIAFVDIRYMRDPATQAHLLMATPEFGRETADLRMPLRIFHIAADGLRPDADEMIVPTDLRPVLSKGALTAGETRIEFTAASSGTSAAPRVYEAWRLGSEDGDLEKLGELSLAPGVVGGSLVTKAPLVAGWRVAIRIGGATLTQARFDVRSAWPVILTVAPDAVLAGHQTEVTIRGTSFQRDMTVRLLRGEVSEPLAFEFIDATTATVKIPPRTSGDTFGLAAVGKGQPTDDPIVPIRAIDVRVRSR